MTNITKGTNDVIASYINGNTFVAIYKDGTKVREYAGVPNIVHPESIDVKITNYCDMGCRYCHESSTIKGVHGDMDKLLSVIDRLPNGVELAIGGGNPLSHPDLMPFLFSLRNKGLIANITINQGHLKTYQNLIIDLIQSELVKGIGISITNNNYKYIKPLLEITDNIVYHVIAGINDISIIDKLVDLGKCKILLLGYKTFGFGEDYHDDKVDENIKQWKANLPNIISKCTFSFDNLAIEQLNVKRLFTKEGWDKFYMGDDFCFTMYIDAVKQEYAPTSRSAERVSFDDMTLEQYFSTRNKCQRYAQ